MSKTKTTKGKTLKTKKSTKTEIVSIINNAKGRFFTVTFKKNNGEPRIMNCKCKGEGKAIDNLGYINVYSAKDKGYRKVNPRTIKSLTFNNTIYIVK